MIFHANHVIGNQASFGVALPTWMLGAPGTGPGHKVDLFAILLIIASAITFIVYLLGGRNSSDLSLSLAILGVVLLNAAIGFFQEYHAERATEALNKLVPVKARIYRDGREQALDASELVPGDVLLLEEGDNISADARLVQAFL